MKDMPKNTEGFLTMINSSFHATKVFPVLIPAAAM